MLKNSLLMTAVAVALTMPATEAFAQGRQTGTLRGTTVDSQGLALPGVSITVTSPAAQGIRSAVTGANGAYQLVGLPPGTYTVSHTLDGFQDLRQVAAVPLGGEVVVRATMRLSGVDTTINVTAVVPSPVASSETAHNLAAGRVERLPLGRDVFRIAELAPGLTANAPNDGQFIISGSFGYDNVFLIDGVDASDNIFATTNDLFIEDAVEETQVLTSGIVAEYGRFSGGVVNVITKSGSNVFSGSFRANLYRPDWTERTPFEVEEDVERSGDLADNATYETTLGGPLIQDRLWFFYANRVQREDQVKTFDATGIGYEDTAANDRNLLKVTGSLAPGHRLEGSYVRNATEETGPSFGFTIDPAGVRTRQIPNDLFVAAYRGALTPSLFTEFQVSRRRRGFRNDGGTDPNIRESPFLTASQQFAHYNAPFFDVTDPQDRDNRQVTGSATYFAETANLGTHSIKGGFEHFTSTLRGGQSQSATGFFFFADYAVDSDGAPLVGVDGRLSPVFEPGGTLLETMRPDRGATLDVTTLSFYVNDNWRLGRHLSLNIGLRAEKVDSDATGDIQSVDTSTVVPRLAASYDVIGDGRFTVHATYGHYAGKYSEAQIGQNTTVGRPDEIVGVYTGPAGQGLDFTPGFDPDNYSTFVGLFPTSNVFFDDSLRSPLTKEFTFGGGTSFGRRGYGKVTYIHRTASDFIEDFFDLDGGTTTIIDDGVDFGTFTNQNFRNTSALERTYDAVEFLAHYQLTSRFVIDASVTVQINNDGNFAGEASNRPAQSSPAFDFPEITPASRYFPNGRLDGFQKHKTRVWGIYTLGLDELGTVDIGGLWRYNSGAVYSIAANGVATNSTQQAILDSLGYASGPAARTVFFDEGRGSRTHPGYGLFDLSLQYQVPVWESLRPWFKAEVFNVFNNDARVGANTTVLLDPDSPLDEFGIPTGFLEGSQFGQATSVNHFPQYLPNLDGLRTFRMSLGFRF